MFLSYRDQIYVRNPNKLTDEELARMFEIDDVPNTEEEIADEVDSDLEEEVINESDHDSDSELSADEDLSDDMDPDVEYYTGKDKKTQWSKVSFFKKTSKTKAHNVVKVLPGARGAARNIENELDAFFKIISNKMLDNIVLCTNIYIDSIKEKFVRERDAKYVSKNELLAFIGLLILSGVKKAGHTSFLELWATDGSGIEIFRSCMSYKRFLFLLRVIRFDNINTRQQRREIDKLAPIRSVLTEFVENCKNSYCLSEFMTIDEMLVPFRGRCGFIQYIPNKPAKYGIKIFALCDAKTFYTGNIEVYSGKQPEGPYSVSNSPSDVVLRLIDYVAGKNRNLTCDNWYSSYSLSLSLLKKKITFLGTLRKNKREIPNEFLPNKKRIIQSSLFGFQKSVMLTSFVPKQNKAVVLISTMHEEASINDETQKPVIIHDYNATKGGVDTVDQLCGNYSVSRRTRRWPLCLFFQLINIAGVNSQVLYQSVKNTKVPRRLFLKNLSFMLMRPHLQDRLKNNKLPADVKLFLQKIIGRNENPRCNQEEEPPQKVRSRCFLCGRQKNRVTTMQCDMCKRSVCKEHSQKIVKCSSCSNNSESTDD